MQRFQYKMKHRNKNLLLKYMRAYRQMNSNIFQKRTNYSDFINKKTEEITSKTLIVEIDAAKNIQWVQFTDFRGGEIFKYTRFENNCSAFKSIFDKINEIKNEKSILIVLLSSQSSRVIIGSLWLFKDIKVILVDCQHIKRVWE